MTHDLSRRIRRLEGASPETAPGFVTLRACSEAGAAAMLAEGERRGEIGPNDLVVTIRSSVGCRPDFRPNRLVAGKSSPILVGFVEPAGEPWPGFGDVPVHSAINDEVDVGPVDVSPDPDAREAMRAELARLKADMLAAQAAEIERAEEQASAPRSSRAFRRVAQGDRVPALNLGRERSH